MEPSIKTRSRTLRRMYQTTWEWILDALPELELIINSAWTWRPYPGGKPCRWSSKQMPTMTIANCDFLKQRQRVGQAGEWSNWLKQWPIANFESIALCNPDLKEKQTIAKRGCLEHFREPWLLQQWRRMNNWISLEPTLPENLTDNLTNNQRKNLV